MSMSEFRFERSSGLAKALDCPMLHPLPEPARYRKKKLRNDGPRRKKITITLSETSIRAFENLKSGTKAESDSDVFRNALCLYLTLLRAHVAGVRFFMKRADNQGCLPVTLFDQS